MGFALHGIAYRRNKPFMPYSVAINATSKCNFRCGICFSRGFDREGEELETQHFYGILDEMSRYKIRALYLSGGEPFMRGDLPDIIEYANERHINVGITTNGALVTKNKLKKIIRSGRNSFTISIDAPNPEINDDLRDHQAYQKAVSALELIRELRSEFGVKCPTAISTVISGLNMDFLVKMVDLASNMNSRISFQPVFAHYGFFNKSFQYHLLEDVFNRFWVKESDRKRFMQIIDTLIKLKQNGSPIINDQTHLALIKRYFSTNNPTMKSLGLQCHVGYRELFIDECGNYRPCWTIDWGVGNIREKGIKEAWFSDKFLYIRSLMKKCPIPCLLQCYYSGSITDKIIELTHNLGSLRRREH